VIPGSTRAELLASTRSSDTEAWWHVTTVDGIAGAM
jgi:hypothetical protein